ncbi:uncharacterized protein STEHIDRAFT_117761 [Stereum hirsutum FP-91666 SS1]|uniref:uncharacterized protein n=1 Tax=Stereum hirsutum (strain FP-91666) TaxID=721885 RepID=UPI00044100A0|nr:uncharacterized protein STEHIDRAFT_117761 [Stereum hirsutum FP-91666 SS1]EIM92799.1 hypothetical protein STEHIDRAFT_117761 [Stereum hirsutum FP-91666 SS1]
MSSYQEPKSVTGLLSRALHRIRTTPPRIIASPPTQPRRAAVALILRVVPPPNFTSQTSTPPSLSDFFQLDWVNHPAARPEILFIQRAKPDVDGSTSNTQEAHVAFPGGRMEEGDEGGQYTAMRQTWEEIGLDLAENDYTCIGQLDDREITTSLGKRLLMILSPFVFLQLSPTQVTTDPNPETTLHWIPLASLLPFSSINSGAGPIWSTVSVDTASRLAPRHSIALRLLMRALVGSMQFPALILSPTSGFPPSLSSPSEKSRGSLEMEAGTFNPALHPASVSPSLRHPTSSALKLWGLSLGMTLDLLAYMSPTPGAPLTPWDADIYMGITRENGEELELNEGWNGSNAGMRNGKDMRRRNGRRHGKGKGRINAPPSLTSVFPRFSYPDVNFWIWVFGKRYREVIRGWEVSIRAGGTNDRRINWTGAALTTFYAAVRKALVVVLVLRAIGVLVSLAFGLWWVFR